MTGNRALLTRWIIGINIGVALLTHLALLKSGWDWPAQVFGFTLGGFLSGSFWQPLTTMWLHAPFVGPGVMHILFNMLTLHFVGRAVETHLGARRLAWIYFPGGLVAVAFFALEVVLRAHLTGEAWTGQPLVGASGALCAVIGVFTMLFPNTRVYVMFLPIPLRARTVLYGFIGISVGLMALGWADFIAHSAHLGGLFYGILYARWMGRRKQRPHFDTTYRRVSPEQMALWEVHTLSNEELAREVEAIRAKISLTGIQTLNFRERLILDRARTESGAP